MHDRHGVPVFLVPELRDGGAVVLGGAEGRHAAAVRRLRPGQRVDLVDGAGAVAEGTVTVVRGGTLEVAVLRRRYEPPPEPRLVVVQALAKGERAELAVELMTEVGVDEIVPWAAGRSVVRWSTDRAARVLARWRVTAREAAKQARRARVPLIRDLAETSDVVERLRSATTAIVLHEAGPLPLAGVPLAGAGDVVLVVGPEGGVSDTELAAFVGAGAATCRLGPTILRTSTAGAAALAVLSVRLGRWT